MDSIRRALSTFTLRSSSTPVVVPQDTEMALELFCHAIVSNQPRQLAELLDKSPLVDVNLRFGRARRTLLHVAAGMGATDCVSILLKRGSNPNAEDQSGNTALHIAARNGEKKALKLLIEYKADIYKANSDGLTTLHWLASNGRTELFLYLLDLKVDIEVTDNQGQTALHVASQNGHRDIVQHLLDLHANIEKQDKSGRTPLYFACRYGQTDCLRLLLQRGATPQADSAGVSPLHLCVRGGFRECVLLFVQRDPRCIESVVLIAAQSSTDDDKVLTVLKYLAVESSGMYKNYVMSCLASAIATEGQKLLSQSSDVDAVSAVFLRMVKFYTELQKLFGSWPPESSGSGTYHDDGLLLSASASASNLLQPSSSASSAGRRNSGAAAGRTAGHARTSSSTSEVLVSTSATLSTSAPSVSSASSSPSPSLGHPPAISGSSTLAPMLSVSATYAANNAAAANGTDSAAASAPPASSSPSPPTRKSPKPSPIPSSPNSSAAAAVSESAGGSLPSTTLAPSASSSSILTPGSFSPFLYNDGYEMLESLWMALEEWLVLLSSSAKASADGATAPAKAPATAPATALAPSAAAERPSAKRGKLATVAEREGLAGSPGPEDDCGSPLLPLAAGAEDSAPTLLSLYADRLATIIHGFYLCSSRKASILAPRFSRFVYEHCTTLRAFVSRNPKIIFKHFHFLLDHSILMDKFIDVVRAQPFADRKEWFYENLHSSKASNPNNDITNAAYLDESKLLVVNRENLFQDSCGMLLHKPAEELRNHFGVRFRGEAGIGAGVQREWFDSLSREILDPDYALFVPSADGSTFQPNPNSHVNPDHLSYFQFAGRIIGMAMYHQQLLDVYFTRSFYKHILGIPISYTDIESIDSGYFKSLQWVLDNQIEGSELDLAFAVEVDNFGKVEVVELKPNGAHIAVTDSNKAEYVQLATQLKMTCAIGPQICSFLDGFHEFVPSSLISIFNEYELELLISGSKEIDVDDWQRNTRYSGFEATDNVIMWFWEIVREYSKDQRVVLLQFVTGSSRVPMGGFANLAGATSETLAFTISKLEGSVDRLPTASTCFNLLKMPVYSSKEMVFERFQLALAGGSKQFDFA